MEFFLPHMTDRKQQSNLSPAVENHESANVVAKEVEFEFNSTFDESPATPKSEEKKY